MALVLENGIWKLEADGVAATPVSLALTPSSGTPSSIADGATLDAGMFTGWTCWNPSDTTLTAASDDGVSQSVTAANLGVTSENGSGIHLHGSFMYPTQLTGDFVAEMEFTGVSIGTSAGFIALTLGSRKTGTDGQFVSASRGHHSNTSGKTRSNTACNAVAAAALYTLEAVSTLWGTYTFVKIERVLGVVAVYWKLNSGDAWSVIDANATDTVGMNFYLHVVFRGTTTGTWHCKQLSFTGTEAAA